MSIAPDAIERLSLSRREPAWMLEFRLRSLDVFLGSPPSEGEPDAAQIEEVIARALNGVAPDSAATSPAARGAAIGAQYESEAVYRRLREEWAHEGVVFIDTDEALARHEDLIRPFWGTVVPPEGDRFAALNGALWAGGSFVHVPKGVRVEVPLQTWFKIDARTGSQFERSLLFVDEGAEVHYLEGCTAPAQPADALHVPVVEIVVRAGGRCTYTSLQNWTKNVFNLVAKRARVEEGGAIRWIDADLGSRWNRKHPAADLLGRGARAEVFSIALAGAGQREDLGARIVHAAPATESRVLARSLARAGGRARFRARIEVRKEARGARVASRCDALILDEPSAAETLPDLDVRAPEATVEHEGAVSRIADDRLYYLESRGIPPEEAEQLIVNGFVAPVVRELPVEYAVEVGRLLAAELQGARRAS